MLKRQLAALAVIFFTLIAAVACPPVSADGNDFSAGVGVDEKKPTGSNSGGSGNGGSGLRTPTLAELLANAQIAVRYFCQGSTGMGYECDAAKKDVADIQQAIADAGSASAAAPEAVVQSIAWEVISTVHMPDPTIKVGPPPTANEWKMAVVGYPLWFWASESGHVTDTNSGHGVTVAIDAVRASTTYGFGDGTSLTCTRTTAWTPSVEPGTPSPTCGHTYTKPSKPGTFTVKATSHWTITWRAAGYSGVETRSFTSTLGLPVGELQSVGTR